MTTPQALGRFANKLDALSEGIGRAVSWLTLALVVLVVLNVSLHLFRVGSVALQELEWHLFALIFLLAAGYTLKHDEHVRVDILYQRLAPRPRAWVDLAGSLLFLLPLCAVIIYSSTPFAYAAFSYQESSPDPGGLPYRFLLKSAIPVAFFLLALQGLSMIARSVATLARTEK